MWQDVPFARSPRGRDALPTRRTEHEKGRVEGCDAPPSEEVTPASGHPEAQKPPLGEGSPHRRYGGCELGRTR